ncbi:hypothetical protein RchiOBHm_Chr3g0488731 [Rosa chinensis]|uniref:Uncharacterized protein n=1 Tax=Rosa chinensis TaxID=74649 RepID=A0A2P6RFW2_ROSCH|nr:hypothetical protein RchiOBHm_Chr3g0488731 [Rosa chinensis]
MFSNFFFILRILSCNWLLLTFNFNLPLMKLRNAFTSALGSNLFSIVYSFMPLSKMISSSSLQTLWNSCLGFSNSSSTPSSSLSIPFFLAFFNPLHHFPSSS